MELQMQQLLSSKQVSARVSLSLSQIRRLISANKFPKPLKISAGRNGWLEKDVDDWVLNLIGGSDND
jgi:predicted DNA-binding transcriptional regulator AlpA